MRIDDSAVMHSPETHRARELRNNMTKVERYLWSRLCNRKLRGFKFRRQVPIGPYFADFACLSARMVIEVDGPHHLEESDALKTAYIEARGYRLLRVPVSHIDESMDSVMDTIDRELDSG